LPALLAKVSVKRSVPANATLVVAGLSTALGLWAASRPDGVGLLASLINMGALIAFLVLHLCVVVHYVVRQRSRRLWKHLVAPLMGFAILTYVVINANVLAQTVGLIWLGVGAVVLTGLYVAGRRPVLAS
jgi:amino acid transporter